MRATAELSAAALALLTAFTTGCGTGLNSGSYASALPGSEFGGQSPLNISCTPVSGQQVQQPYFIGQNVQCVALSNGSPVTVQWSTSAGAVDHFGLITRVTDPADLTVSAHVGAGSASGNRQHLTLKFTKPLGAPGHIFSAPIATGVAMWNFVVDGSNQIYGAGWSAGTTTPNAELFTMDFWERQPRTAAASRPSLLTAAALINNHPAFGGGNIDTASYRPLLVSSDSGPNFLTSEECPAAGMLTALAFDSTRGVAWGAWSGDNGAGRIRIDQQSFRLECSAMNQLVSSTSAQTKVPWVWSIHATDTGTVAAGHYITGSDTIGFVKMDDEDGTEINTEEFTGLADIRVTPPIHEHEVVVFYIAGHDTTNGQDVWTVKKLDASLQPLWTKQWSIAQAETEPLSIIPDTNGGVILSGKATQLAPAGGNTKLTDAVLMSVDDAGNLKWGPIRINPSNTGTDACVATSVKLTPDSKFLLVLVNCGQSTIDSYLLGFAVP